MIAAWEEEWDRRIAAARLPYCIFCGFVPDEFYVVEVMPWKREVRVCPDCLRHEHAKWAWEQLAAKGELEERDRAGLS